MCRPDRDKKTANAAATVEVMLIDERAQFFPADRPRGVEQPRKKLADTKKRAEDTKNSSHAKNTTPGFRSILACDGPKKGCGILNFTDFVPRILYTWYALVSRLVRTFCSTASS